MQRIALLISLALTACSPQVSDSRSCELGSAGCAPDKGSCDEGVEPSPVGICLDVVYQDESIDECPAYAVAVSDQVVRIRGRRFCLPLCDIDDADSCTADATGFGHDLRCIDFDGTAVCGVAAQSGW